MKVHKVLYGEGDQTISTVPSDNRGNSLYVTSGTYSIEDLRYSDDDASSRVIASGNITFGGLSTALTAAAGATQSNPRLLTVTDETGFLVGHTYQLSGLSGNELVEIDTIDASNNRIYTRHNIRGTYTSSVVLRSVELECTFPSAEANDETKLDDLGGPYIVVWEFSANGKEYKVAEQIFVERYDERPFISEQDVFMAYPGLANRARGGIKVEDAIKVAQDDFLATMEASGKKPAYFLTSRAGKMAVRDRAIEYLLRWQQTDQDDAQADKYESRYNSMCNNILNGRPDDTTVEIEPVNNTAPAGTSRDYGFTLLRRS